MHNSKKTVLFVSSFLFCLSTAIASPTFSKVYFFGDSLTDVGNNRDGFLDQAPVTNKEMNKQGEFVDGAVWAKPFLEFMKKDGLLASNATLKVLPSAKIKDATPEDSINFAYSGDPSGGYNGVLKTYHPSFFNKPLPNATCTILGTLHPGENDLCGMYNRIHNFAIQYDLDKNALFVIWVGANDIMQSPDLGWELFKKVVALKIDPEDSAILKAADRLGDAVAANITASMQDLIAKGATNFLVVNVPKIGYTPVASSFDNAYTLLRSNKHGAVIQMLNNVSLQVNAKIALALQNLIKNNPQITVYSPDINIMLDAMHNGEILAFPPSSSKVNFSPALAWDQTCCINQMLKMPNYIPGNCKPVLGKENVCNHGSIALLNGQGYFAFFNYIHPSTCAHRYIARFLEQFIHRVPFDPKEKLCS